MEQKKWWASKGVIGSIAALVGVLLTYAGKDISSSEIETTIGLVISAVGSVLSIWGRLSAEKKVVL